MPVMVMKGICIFRPRWSSTAGIKIPKRSGVQRRNDPLGERPNYLLSLIVKTQAPPPDKIYQVHAHDDAGNFKINERCGLNNVSSGIDVY
jgi:hypothetical protein